MNFPALFAKKPDSVSVLANPFNKESIEMVHLWMIRSSVDRNRVSISGDVKFQNGQTRGEQSFEAESLADLIEQVQAFIETLPK